MTTYYRDNRLHITSTEIRVDGRRFALAELTYVWHGRGVPDPRLVSRRTGRVLLLLAGAVLAIGCAVKTPALLRMETGIPSLTARILLTAAGSFALVAVGWPLVELVLVGMDHVHLHGVAMHEIRAHWRGEEVLLLRTPDSLLFGRVYRALERALEQQSD
ncbi:MAG TPA: DUF6232 family protein [Micromonosporaceae bacterium]|jgi:hypothetical protein|nr:DUF6232 family protein [Micromonosporaceae bacterium]